ncbi:MAG: phosphoenolpyruvate synthase [Dehalococcoidia bacterium]
MSTLTKIIAWFKEIGKDDIGRVGGKGANLGEMSQANIPIPPGFIVTAQAYFSFLESAGLRGPIQKLLVGLDPESEQLHKTAAQLQKRIMKAEMPAETARQIEEAYAQMGGLVAVRSSATAEDLPSASFAGQHSTFLNVRGGKEVVQAVHECWASLFEPRAIFYRVQHGFDHLQVGIAAVVQRMVPSDISGTLFTADPHSGDHSRIIIEAVYGLGEALVSGEVQPDTYTMDKDGHKLLETRVNAQEWELKREPGSRDGYSKVPISSPRREAQKVSEAQIAALAEIGSHIEELYGTPQDIEWAIDGASLYIVQSRPITTLTPKWEQEIAELVGEVVAEGVAASRGVAWGPVKIISGTSEIAKVEKGDVLVAKMTNPDLAPAMNRAAGIITDEGGLTSHAAIVSREMGIPCVVGTSSATKVLKNGQIVTVDGFRGRVYKGKVAIETGPTVVRAEKLRTRTRVYVNLADPSRAEHVASLDVDGVGLLRAEFIIAHYIREHPRYMLSRGRGAKFTEKLADAIGIFAKAFYPRPVVYRTTDFKTNEYRNLKGGRAYEVVESNPMLGYRGCSRYIRDMDAFILEVEAIKKVRQEYDNLWVMIPFVRTPREMATSKEIMHQAGLEQSPNFKLWMMVEVPSNVLLIDQFLDVGIDGISIGSNDLTQLVLGIDRDSRLLAEDFDEQDEAVMVAMEKVITTSKQRAVTSSICGQAPSNYPDLTMKLVQWGINSVSVTPDMIDQTREVIAGVEARLGITPEPAEA